MVYQVVAAVSGLGNCPPTSRHKNSLQHSTLHKPWFPLSHTLHVRVYACDFPGSQGGCPQSL